MLGGLYISSFTSGLLGIAPIHAHSRCLCACALPRLPGLFLRYYLSRLCAVQSASRHTPLQTRMTRTWSRACWLALCVLGATAGNSSDCFGHGVPFHGKCDCLQGFNASTLCKDCNAGGNITDLCLSCVSPSERYDTQTEMCAPYAPKPSPSPRVTTTQAPTIQTTSSAPPTTSPGGGGKTTSKNPDGKTSASPGLGAGAIIGIVAAIFVVVGAGAFWYIRRREGPLPRHSLSFFAGAMDDGSKEYSLI